jgi:DNA polymerase (family 10)
VMLDWPRIFEAAARTGTALEMNGSPRLDLDDALGRAAINAGVRLTLASDSHRTEELDQLRYAVSTARRGWVQPDNVLNRLTADELTVGTR